MILDDKICIFVYMLKPTCIVLKEQFKHHYKTEESMNISISLSRNQVDVTFIV